MMTPSFSLYYALAASLQSKKSSKTITSQEDLTRSSSKGSLHRMNRLARLKKLWLFATGATLRFMTGRTHGQPGKASASATDSEESFAFLFPDPENEQPPPHVECHPSTTDSAVAPTSVEDHFAVNVEPYFVRSTASASEVLTNVAIQDMLAADELEYYELSCNPRSPSTLSSVPEPSGTFDFVYPFASSESLYSDSEPLIESPRSAREGSPVVSPDPSERHEALNLRPVQINTTMWLISSSGAEVTFSNTYADSPLGDDDDDDDDDEEVIVIPVFRRVRASSSFPHPHCLSTIPEEDEDDGGDSPSLDGTYDYEDETSSVETVRPTSLSVSARPDTGFVNASDDIGHLCESSPVVGSDHRMSI